jgi:hypothetical protein
MQCPKCRFEHRDGIAECPRCGVVYAKLRSRDPAGREGGNAAAEPAVPGGTQLEASVAGQERRFTPEPAEMELLPLGPLSIDRAGWQALAAGLALALILPLFPFLNFLLHPIVTLTHELGHALFAWLCGIVAIPSFDFIHGGGVTHEWGGRQPVLIALIAGGYGWMAWHSRADRLRLAFWCSAAVVHLAAVSTVHGLVILYMGHGFTLVVAGVFLWRGVGGWGCHWDAERPLYAFVGFWMIFGEMRFAYGLLTRPSDRAIYRQGKGGMAHDFVRISEDHWLSSLDAVARFHLFCCVASVALALAAWWGRHAIGRGLRWAFGTEDAAQS